MAENGKEPRTALSLGAGSLAAAGTSVASGLLSQMLARGIEGGRQISLEEAERLSQAMGFPKSHPLLVRGKRVPAWTGTWLEMPGGTPRKPGMPLAAMAHELGHATETLPGKGPKLQKALRAVSGALFSRPMGVSFSPLHVPLMVAAATPKSEDKRVRWIQEHPTEMAAAIAAAPLLQEAQASGAAFQGIRKMPGGGTREAVRALGPLSRGFVTHTLSHVPAIAAIWVTSKIRDWLQSRKEGSIEKRGSAETRSMVILSFASFKK